MAGSRSCQARSRVVILFPVSLTLDPGMAHRPTVRADSSSLVPPSSRARMSAPTIAHALQCCWLQWRICIDWSVEKSSKAVPFYNVVFGTTGFDKTVDLNPVNELVGLHLLKVLQTLECPGAGYSVGILVNTLVFLADDL